MTVIMLHDRDSELPTHFPNGICCARLKVSLCGWNCEHRSTEKEHLIEHSVPR